MYFRKKPVTIEAVQVTWKNWGELCDFMGEIINEKNPGRHGEASETCDEEAPYINITIPTPEGDVVALHGDWVAKGYSSKLGTHFWPIKPDYMRENYEQVSEQEEN